MMRESTWLAVHIWYAEPFEKLLLGFINPLRNTDLFREKVECFFFIRYWRNGPHIRLRLKGDASVMEHEVKPALSQMLKKFLEASPSSRDDPPWVVNLPTPNLLRPNNSFDFIPYEPEWKRYGGEKGMPISESQFEASSKAVLAVIEKSKDWGYTAAMANAIVLHLGLLRAFNMNLQQATRFCSNLLRHWIGYSQPKTSSGKAEPVPVEALIRMFRASFEKQQSTLIPLVSSVWAAFSEQQHDLEDQWMRDWYFDMLAIRSRMELHWPKEVSEGGIDPVLMIMYESFVHMTNNRLGIRNRDEAYLGYLLTECLKTIPSR